METVWKMSATEVEIKGYRRFSPMTDETMNPRVSSATALGSQGGRCSRNQTHHTMTQAPSRSGFIRPSDSRSSVIALMVCVQAPRITRVSGHQQEENRAHPHIDRVGTVKASQAKGDNCQQKKKKPFEDLRRFGRGTAPTNEAGTRPQPRRHRPATAPCACRLCQPGSPV